MTGLFPPKIGAPKSGGSHPRDPAPCRRALGAIKRPKKPSGAPGAYFSLSLPPDGRKNDLNRRAEEIPTRSASWRPALLTTTWALTTFRTNGCPLTKPVAWRTYKVR
jgi:hypothetical protein